MYELWYIMCMFHTETDTMYTHKHIRIKWVSNTDMCRIYIQYNILKLSHSLGQGGVYTYMCIYVYVYIYVCVPEHDYVLHRSAFVMWFYVSMYTWHIYIYLVIYLYIQFLT